MASTLPDRQPDFSCGLLKIWVLGRQYPNATDYWDGNWLRAIAHCAAKGASVTVSGSLLHLSQLAVLREQLTRMNELLTGTAELPILEAELKLYLVCDRTGHVKATCKITPDNLNQSHTFTYEIDQTHLGPCVRQCDHIFREYPIRDPEQKL